MSKKETLIIQVKVVPHSGRQEFQVDKNGTLKCFLKSAPERGKANMELMKLVAQRLKIPQYQVQLISGQTTRLKVLRIFTLLSYEEFLERIK